MEINLNYLKNKLKNQTVIYKKVTTSTNVDAANHLEQYPNESGIIIAGQQTAGKGTHQRDFYSPTSGIYFSIFLPINGKKPFYPGRVTANMGVIVAKSIKKVFNQNIQLKWVNDVYLHNKKVGGILCEVVTNLQNQIIGLVLGCGLNITTAEFPVGMFRVGGQITNQASTQQVTNLILNIVNDIQKKHQTIQFDAIDKKYLDLMLLNNKKVVIEQFDQKIKGRVQGVTDNNELIIINGIRTQIISVGRVIDWQD